MKYFFTICLSLLATISLRAQKDSFLLVRTYQGDIVDAAMDNLDNLYIISSGGQIKKYNSTGDSVAVFNQVKNSGKLFSLDVSNPLKLLLFYKDFSTVVVLDRFLAKVTSVDLRRVGILQPGAVGLSYDNNIWVFDEWDNKLKRINEQGNHLLETADFRSIFQEGLSPQKIINDNGFVYLADSARGIFVFDNYGTYKKLIPVKNWQSIAINNNNVISIHDDVITVFNSATLLQKQGRMPFFKPYLHAFSSGNKFISFSTGQLQVYQYSY